ncbi:restriction endonuclease [Georgenia sp. TF02-10]|uniref:restriction endonuclease n=1 Tax=Georgenia sp. TF02-10 TaxID=2917725 RepID=UPI001FA6ECCF|nr:restriction endonuclease [Georgenia sp. TF02-10]UNX54404.1 restriction endonuclease [Georgenia sp. TF02-10]
MTDPLPTWQDYMAPALHVLIDGEVHRARDVCTAAADHLGVSPEERAQLIPSGQPRYLNRGMWALSYLARAGAVDRPARGRYRITDVGRRLLATHPDGIAERDLREPPDYVSPYARSTAGAAPEAPDDAAQASAGPSALAVVVGEEAALSPTEQVEEGIERIHAGVVSDLLRRLHEQEPAFFEQAVLDLLMAMGYGGAEGRATRTQLTNDGGIDGIIDQDALGLSRVYVQAKRYAVDAVVGRPEIQAFVGALHGNQASQGVFITTGRFSRSALEFADAVATRVVLVDGARLARLMIKYRVGVQVRKTYDVVEVDEDFFE